MRSKRKARKDLDDRDKDKQKKPKTSTNVTLDVTTAAGASSAGSRTVFVIHGQVHTAGEYCPTMPISNSE